MKNEITIQLRTGHMIHQLDAISEVALLLKKRLQDIPHKYCADCGGELVTVGDSGFAGDVTVKECKKCKDRCIFDKNG